MSVEVDTDAVPGVMLKLGTYGFWRFAVPLFPVAARQYQLLFAALAVVAARAGADEPRFAEGAATFKASCAVCHRPAMQTGRSEIAALSERPVFLYSDLLLHDVGTGDGIAQGAAGPNEMRTPPLWGLRLRKQLLHDGSALNAEQAIERHGGEAARVRDRYRNMPQRDQQSLLLFLGTL